jgi:SAM-dependent methyltransferase
VSVAFWDDPATVQRFAEREPDLRMVEHALRFATPSATRVLDLGCAGGRNTAWLAARGFDVHARDTSAAMIEATRAAVAPALGDAETRRRVVRGSMVDLEDFATGSLDLVLALGLYQNAETAAEWDAALDETARVLSRGGTVLVANFTPDTTPSEGRLTSVPGDPGRYSGFPSGRSTLYQGPELDVCFAKRGLVPWTPTRVVERPTETGRRVTANAHYVKR